MKHLIFLLGIVLVHGAELKAQHRTWNYIAIQGEVRPQPPSTDSLTIQLEVDSHPGERFNCVPPYAAQRSSVLCVARVPVRARYARMTVFRWGYARYSRNLPVLSFRRDTAKVHLQPIELTLPKLRLDPVVLALEGDTVYRFQLTVRNRFARDTVWLREMSINAMAPSGSACFSGTPYEVYEVRPVINIHTQSGKANRFSGNVRQRIGRPEAVMPIEGSFNFESCSSNTELSLRIPLRVELPAGSVKTVDIAFPINFTVTSQRTANPQAGRPSMYSQELQERRCINNALAHLTEFIFTIRTDSTVEPDLNIRFELPASVVREQSRHRGRGQGSACGR